MQRLIVMCGPSGSGKTSWAYIYSTLHPRTRIISTDDIREELFGDASVQANPQKVFALAHKRLKVNLSAGFNVIFDAMNLSPKDRRAIISDYKQLYPKLVCICVVPKATLEMCMERQHTRERQVPSDVVKSQFNRFQKPTLDEGWNIISTDEQFFI